MPTIINTEEISKSLLTQNLNVLGSNVFEVLTEKGVLIIEVIKIDIAEKSIKIRNNHNTYDLLFKDSIDFVLDKMGIKRNQENINQNLKAPMPGKVLEVLVKEGEKLQKGDSLLILEAMKMENVLKAEFTCEIKKVHVVKQENVDKNQLLIELNLAEY